MPELTFTIPGDAVAKGRGRIAKLGKHMGIITPEKTRRYEFTVREHAIRATAGSQPIATACTLQAVFFRSIPESWSKKKQHAALMGTVRPTSKPDLDNLIKSIKDGCNGVVWRDDAQIVDTHGQKFYGAQPRVEIRVTWI